MDRVYVIKMEKLKISLEIILCTSTFMKYKMYTVFVLQEFLNILKKDDGISFSSLKSVIDHAR